eukprot:3024292-Ditylum_brightwellii.AAC.1
MDKGRKNPTTSLGQVSGVKTLHIPSEEKSAQTKVWHYSVSLDKALKTDSTITKYIEGEDTVVGATCR